MNLLSETTETLNKTMQNLKNRNVKLKHLPNKESVKLDTFKKVLS